MSDISVRFELRRDTAANWTASNPVLLSGEPGVETDTGKLKIGDGATAWAILGYIGSGFANPMTAAGDLILGGTAGAATRLPIGASGTVLTSNGTTANWQVPSGQLTGMSATAPATYTLPVGYNVYDITLSAGTSGSPGVITLRAPAGKGDLLILNVLQGATGGYTYELSGGTATITYASGQTPSISTGANDIDTYFATSEDGTNWVIEPSGVFLPPTETVYTNSSATGSVTLQDPTLTGATIQRYVVPNSGSLTLVNPAYKTGNRITVRVTTGTGTTVTLPSTATRYGAGGVSAAGSAFVIPASASVEFVVSMVDGTNYDYSPPVRYA